MFYLIFGYTDPILLIENAVWSLTPWLFLGGAVLVDRVLRGRFHARRSYFITALLVSLLFQIIPLHVLAIGSRAILVGAFEMSAAVSIFFFALNYVFELINDELG